jgi:hypothetical protein
MIDSLVMKGRGRGRGRGGGGRRGIGRGRRGGGRGRLNESTPWYINQKARYKNGLRNYEHFY